MGGLQLNMSFKKHIWSCPSEYKDLTGATEIAIDLETRDEGINNGLSFLNLLFYLCLNT